MKTFTEREAEHWRWLRHNQGKHPNLRDCLNDYTAAMIRIAKLESERRDWIAQAEQGVMVAHDCPAMFACASIIADSAPSESGDARA